MTSANMKLYHHFHCICSSYFIYTLMYLNGHIFTVCSLCSLGIRTYLSNLLASVRDIQPITSFTIYL